MTDEILLAERFEAERPRLRGLAMRMLGSDHAADDAVQEAWIRLVRTDAGPGEEIDNLPGWLTTVVSRICLDMLRTKTRRREDAWSAIADVVDAAPTPEEEAELVDAVGQAMTVVLDTLAPAERLAYVLKDVFAVPFEQIAPILGRSEVATRQLASRARRRIQEPEPREDLAAADTAVVDAFLQASRDNEFDALLELLDPEAPCGPRRRRSIGDGRRGRHRHRVAVPWRSSSPAVPSAALPATLDGAAAAAGSSRARSKSSSASRSSTARSSRSSCWPTPPCSRVRADAHLADSQRCLAAPRSRRAGHLLFEGDDPSSAAGAAARRSRHLAARTLLVPHARDLTVDEQHRVVAGLARRRQRPLGVRGPGTAGGEAGCRRRTRRSTAAAARPRRAPSYDAPGRS